MKLAKSNNSFQLAPEGTTQAVLVDVVDMGMQPGYNEGELTHKLKLVFQTEDETDEGTPFIVSTFPMNASVNSKSNLFKNYIKPILGRGLEEGDFDADDELDLDGLLIGKNANITIEHKTKGENTYANIVGVGALNTKKQTTLLEPRNYVRVQDREDTSFNYGENATSEENI